MIVHESFTKCQRSRNQSANHRAVLTIEQRGISINSSKRTGLLFTGKKEAGAFICMLVFEKLFSWEPPSNPR